MYARDALELGDVGLLWAVTYSVWRGRRLLRAGGQTRSLRNFIALSIRFSRQALPLKPNAEFRMRAIRGSFFAMVMDMSSFTQLA